MVVISSDTSTIFISRSDYLLLNLHQIQYWSVIHTWHCCKTVYCKRLYIEDVNILYFTLVVNHLNIIDIITNILLRTEPKLQTSPSKEDSRKINVNMVADLPMMFTWLVTSDFLQIWFEFSCHQVKFINRFAIKASFYSVYIRLEIRNNNNNLCIHS